MATARTMFLSAVAAGAANLDLANWMGSLEPVLGNATLLDLSLPGAHDAMTYDLSHTISEGYEGMGPALSKILHSVTPLVAGRFIRDQGKTQGINITSMLDSGVRFIDFRIMFTEAPEKLFSKKDWYSLHGCESNLQAVEYLKQARAWLDQHPKEIVVFWASRHGNTGATGTDQYPATTPAQRQAFFQQVSNIFDGMFFDTARGSALNATSISELWQRGQRVIWYASDYAESTGNSSIALDARLIDNELGGDGPGLGGLKKFRSGARTLATDKSQNRFYLQSMASSGPGCQVEAAAFMTYLPFLKKEQTKKCAACLKKGGVIPEADPWCPMTLQEIGQLTNYYNQLSLDTAYLEGADDPEVDFPNAIYIDGLDHDGQIRTGTARVGSGAVGDQETAGYAYSATLIGATIRRLCRMDPSRAEQCRNLAASAEALRARFPLQRWNDTFGRRDNWPEVPPKHGLLV